MSENNKDNKMQISVEVDSKSLEDKIIENENLKAEIDQLKADLTLIAQKAMDEKCDKYGIDKNLTDDQKIALIKDTELSHGSTATLNEFQTSDSNNYDGFDSEEDALIAISKAKKAGNAKSAEVETKLGKKYIEKPINFEIENLKDLARRPQKLGSESQDSYNKRLTEYYKKQSYKNLNFNGE